jgi:virginiamycin B lyase
MKTMHTLTILARGLLLGAALAIPVMSHAQQAQPSTDTVTITEWPVPWENTRPRDPAVAPNGEIWLVGQGGDYVARFDQRNEKFTRKDLPAGSGPHNLVIDRGANIWIAGNRQGWIGRMNPNSGQLKQFKMPDDSVKDPHTLALTGHGELWFTAQWSNRIGRLNQRTGEVDLVALPLPKTRPYGIRLDASGRPWVALLGTNALATVDPNSLEVKLIVLPREEARLRRVDLTSDGLVWYTDYNGGYLGQYNPATGEFSEWKNPSERSGPYAMAVDSKDRVWFVETWTEPNQLVGFDPETEEFFGITPIPSGAGSVRHMVYDAITNSLWFGTDTNNLAQAKLP